MARRRKRSYREIRDTVTRLQRTYGVGANRIANNNRIMRAGKSATKNLAKSLRVEDRSLLRFPKYIDKRGFTTARLGSVSG